MSSFIFALYTLHTVKATHLNITGEIAFLSKQTEVIDTALLNLNTETLLG